MAASSTKDQKLLDTVAAFLGRQPNATMDEIAVAVGVGRATLHRYFAGRVALITALNQLAVTRASAALEGARLDEGPASEALRRLVSAYESVAPYLALLLHHYRDLSIEEAETRWLPIDRQIQEVFLRGQRAGEFRAELTAAWFSDALHALIVAADYSIASGRVAKSGIADTISTMLLDGIRRPDPQSPGAA
ncbi:hypothetical protein AWB85_13210 [Mycobacteroides immunogenum]|uniref:HTH tetR-type domain-containing protein n=1 Tax=Mycobacteroides immunogenum TaxID=83262 RepID=A0A179V7P6_9MYCO|nr:TetR/AcrR family transcriptional regulator [Mycobacteroides immunogenum]OAT67122.1 hypothetical protein AWB85_13210 [Mycobacteroides immunogenum]